MRQPKWTHVGIYQPTDQPRRAYGPRGVSGVYRAYVENQADVLTANAAARYVTGAVAYGVSKQSIVSHVTLMPLPMPRGGVRWVLECPQCHARATRLYGRYLPFYRDIRYACRRCCFLRYESQYAGRRPEAHPEYVQRVQARQIAGAPHEPRGVYPVPARPQMAMHRHAARIRAYTRALDTNHARRMRQDERREAAFLLTEAVLVARFDAHQAKRWAWLLPTVIERAHRERDASDLRTLLAKKSDMLMPPWGETLLREHIAQIEREREHTAAKAPDASIQDGDMLKTLQNAAKTAVRDDETAHFTGVIDQARIDALRARYAALGQHRRKRAA